jgi:hypothetical protein
MLDDVEGGYVGGLPTAFCRVAVLPMICSTVQVGRIDARIISCQVLGQLFRGSSTPGPTNRLAAKSFGHHYFGTAGRHERLSSSFLGRTLGSLRPGGTASSTRPAVQSNCFMKSGLAGGTKSTFP